jgi:ABC-type glycerol-3-phosphate transport system substrate-binding protein
MSDDNLEKLNRPYFSTHGGIVNVPSLWGKYERFASAYGPHGFRVNLPNGNTVSVQWGPANYCDNHHGPMREPKRFAVESRPYTSRDAEIAAWREAREGEIPYTSHNSNVWHNFAKDSHVKGWMRPEEVLEFIDFAASNELDVRKWSYDYDLDEYVLVGNCPTLGKEGEGEE